MPSRRLLITADDFGIGPATSRGILDLATAGVLTSTVLLVNSPYAADGVAQWQRAGRPLELGWHPVLTLDRPLSAPGRVPSLVDPDGRFYPLGTLLKRLARSQIDRDEVRAEFQAQLDRYRDWVGPNPANVNAHHHVHIFRPIGDALAEVLAPVSPRPYVRRVRESATTLASVPGARLKRAVLSAVGSRAARRQALAGFPGADAVVGITDPAHVHHPEFFTRWLRAGRGADVELACHPGHLDETLAGRDGTLADGQLHRRAAELARLADPAFLDHVRAAGFHLVTAAELMVGATAGRLAAAG